MGSSTQTPEEFDKEFIENTPLEEIKKWRSICPEITLRSTFIVGYPGETEDDFLKNIESL